MFVLLAPIGNICSKEMVSFVEYVFQTVTNGVFPFHYVRLKVVIFTCESEATQAASIPLYCPSESSPFISFTAFFKLK